MDFVIYAESPDRSRFVPLLHRLSAQDERNLPAAKHLRPPNPLRHPSCANNEELSG
jgi:hypothetical protein